MKIIQITDPHLIGHSGELYGRDPLARLNNCLEDIVADHADAAFCVITGDLADKGDAASYQALQDAIKTLPMPCHLLIGNHDSRQTFTEVFPNVPRDRNGYIQSVVTINGARFIFMDTNDPGEHSGCYDPPRLDWLQEQLTQGHGEPTYLFMHHPPFDVGIPSLDRIKLRNPEKLGQTVEPPGNHVRHLFLGHVHRPISGSWRGIPFSTLPSLHHQVPLDFQSTDEVPRSNEPPAYAVIFIDETQTTVHFHNFLGCREST